MAVGLSTFVNRTSELSALETWFRRSGAGLGVVWGRKRVGKSWLLARFAEGRRSIHHVARARPGAEELHLLTNEARAVVNVKRRSLIDRPFRDWDDAFEVLADAAESAPLLVILDEFPELMTATPNLEEELRAIWDRVGRDSNLKLLICGSAVRVMEARQQHDAALFGRADLRLQVHPFRPHESARMLPGMSGAERAAVWGVCGGIPRYLAMWDTEASFAENLTALVANEQGLLLSEGELVLADEDIAGHRGERLPEQVLRTIASGSTTFSAIHSALGRLPTRTLEHLVDVRLLERVVPVTEDPARSRRTYYRIADNFLAFWLRCVEPYRAQVERGLGKTVASVIRAGFDDYMGPRYEHAFREFLRRRAGDGAFGDEVVAVGEWWRAQGDSAADPCQLDAVVLAGRRRSPVAVGEAKWSKRVSGSRLAAELRRKVVESGLADPTSLAYVVCARETVTSADGVVAVTAADIFS